MTSDHFKPFYIPEGTSIGKYTVRTAVGRGGGQMAYLAHDPNNNLMVLKVSLSPRGETGTRDRMMHERFIRQVQYFLQLRDVPGIAKVYEYGMHPDNSENGYSYLVQEWVWDGIDIVSWHRAAPRPLEFVVRSWMCLASSCGAMEERGICHRDLKPANILVSPLGVPKIIDFNTGMSVGAAPLTANGPGGWWPGTLAYFSPELCRAILAEWDSPGQEFTYRPTCDLYALGTIFYETLTGEHPFDENAPDAELFQQIAYKAPERPSALNPEVPFGLEKVTMRLLQKNPEERYQTGGELAHDLERLLETPEDWNRPFQTPARDRHSDSTTCRPQTMRTSTGAPPYTPRAAAGSAALNLVPSAMVLAGPRALAVKGPRQLLRVVPAPAALVAPADAVEPTHRRLASRGRVLPLAALLAVVFVVPWIVRGQHLGSRSFFERGAMALGKAKAAVVAATSTVFAACVGLKVRTGERDWLETCSPEARKNAAELDLQTSGGAATLLAGPNILIPDEGVELRDGPVEASAFFSTPQKAVQGHLLGEIRTGTDGASIRFTKLKLFSGSEPKGQPPAGREVDICAIAYVPGYGDDPGIPKVEDQREPPELHPGFTYVTTKALMVHLAH